jgi:LacI family transcriptional regulator
MPKQRKRVLIATGWYDYRLHRGLEKYALEHNWHLTADLTRGRVIPWGWDGDGILASLAAGDDLADFVVQARKPTVDFSFRRPQLKFPRVLEDHAHAAALVAEHFVSRGFSNFLFYSEEPIWAYEERGKAFVESLKRWGHECVWIRWNESPTHRADVPNYRTDRGQWKRHRSWLTGQLKRATRPVAVFAANDTHALDVVAVCESCGMKIPEEVSIVGADDYLMAPDALQIPISSVDTNLEALGYRGAQLLDALMQGRRAPDTPIRVPAAGVVIRRSSDLLAVNHPGVAKSLRFILNHSHEPIHLKHLIAAAGMSRRGLHKAFRQHLGRSPGQEIQRVRIERAKRLLAATDQKMHELASRCGYYNSNSFYFAFRNATGMSPTEFRRAVGTGTAHNGGRARM